MKRINIKPLDSGGEYIRMFLRHNVSTNDVEIVQTFSQKTSLHSTIGIGDPWYLFNYRENTIKKMAITY